MEEMNDKSTSQNLNLETPLNTVFISGIPLPSASGDIKYPTLVAHSIKNMDVITQIK